MNYVPVCTYGFAVWDWLGGKGVTTAGHCPPGTYHGGYGSSRPTYYAYPGVGPLSMTLVWDYYGGSYDVQYDKPPQNETYRGEIRLPWGYYKVKNQIARAQLSYGMQSCAQGRTTGTNCGTIYQTDATIFGANTWILVSPPTWTQTGPLCTTVVCGGDSGGPAFYATGDWYYGGLTAQGHRNGMVYTCQNQTDPCDNIGALWWSVMSVDYINAKGIYLYFEQP